VALSLKRRIFELLEETDSRASRWVQSILIALIALNVAAVMIESVDELRGRWTAELDLFEKFSVAVFSVEYVLRAWVVTCREKHSRPVLGRLKYLITPLALLDLMSILPFYLPILLPFDLRFLRAMRILRLGKFGRYSSSVRILRNVLADRKDELLATLSILAMVVVLASGMMYVAEHEAQPNVFTSIPATMYWAAATLTTMAYGDMKPVTSVGKVLASCIAVCGIGLFALPAGILGSGFVEKYMELRRGKRCPHCGKSLDQPSAADDSPRAA
jgi:voltage-gated potassium channel